MKSDKLIEQIETYSNAIVAFAVLQALAYSYAFGSNEMFNCLVKAATFLATGLTLLFLFVMVLLVLGIHYCRKTLLRVIEEHRDVVGKVYLAKMVAVVLFSLVPILLTYHYGVMIDAHGIECNKLLRPGAGA